MKITNETFNHDYTSGANFIGRQCVHCGTLEKYDDEVGYHIYSYWSVEGGYCRKCGRSKPEGELFIDAINEKLDGRIPSYFYFARDTVERNELKKAHDIKRQERKKRHSLPPRRKKKIPRSVVSESWNAEAPEPRAKSQSGVSLDFKASFDSAFLCFFLALLIVIGFILIGKSKQEPQYQPQTVVIKRNHF